MKAVMYGAGNIGRGFIGQLLSQSGFEVSFIDVNMQVIDALNERKSYPVEILDNEGNEEILVKNVCGVNGMDQEAIANAIAGADVMATAVGVNILPGIVGNIANGIKLRFKNGNFKPFNIIICENLIDADKYLREEISKYLNEQENKKFNEVIGLVEASIGRMVPIQTPEMTKNDILRVCVERFSNLIVDRDAFKGEIPPITNMSSYAPFRLYIERKLYIHNMGHSMAAYLGNLKGYEYIWQAIEDSEIESFVCHAMMSSALSLSINYNADAKPLFEHVEDLLYRFTNKQLGDTVFRVGRDRKRKLAPSDRIAGTIESCKKAGVNPVYIYCAYAAALCFKLDDTKDMSPSEILKEFSGYDENSTEYKEIMKLYELAKSENGIKKMMDYAKLSVRA